MRDFLKDITQSVEGLICAVVVTIVTLFLFTVVAAQHERDWRDQTNSLNSRVSVEAVRVEAATDGVASGGVSRNVAEAVESSEVSVAFTKSDLTETLTICDSRNHFQLDFPQELRSLCTEKSAVISLREGLRASESRHLGQLRSPEFVGHHQHSATLNFQSPVILASPQALPFSEGKYFVAGSDVARSRFIAKLPSFGLNLVSIERTYQPQTNWLQFTPLGNITGRLLTLVVFICLLIALFSAVNRVGERCGALKIVGVPRRVILRQSMSALCLVTAVSWVIGCFIPTLAWVFGRANVEHVHGGTVLFSCLATSSSFLIFGIICVTIQQFRRLARA